MPSIDTFLSELIEARDSLLETGLFDAHDEREIISKFTLYLRGTNYAVEFSVSPALSNGGTYTMLWRDIHRGYSVLRQTKYIPFERVLESLDDDIKVKLCFHLDLFLKK